MQMKQRTLLVSILAALLSLVIIGTSGAQRVPNTDSDAYNYDRWAMVGNIMANSTVMLQEAFVDQTTALQSVAQTFSDGPNLENLEELQSAWRETTQAWYVADIIGYDQSTLWRNQISKPPINEDFVEKFIAENDTIDEAFISTIGSTSKGLPAIEYLIFDPDGDNQTILDSLTTGDRATQRLQYMVGCVDYLHTVGQEYLDGWVALQDHYLNNRRNTDQLELIGEMELRDITNALIDTVENIVSMKLGQPLGKTTGGDPRPDLVEFNRADFALDIIIAQLEGLKVIFNGETPDGDGIGYDDHIAFVNAEFEGIPLEDAINNQINLILEQVQALDAPIEELVLTNYETVDTIYESVRTLVRLIKADMTSHLAIELVFSDNDGD